MFLFWNVHNDWPFQVNEKCFISELICAEYLECPFIVQLTLIVVILNEKVRSCHFRLQIFQLSHFLWHASFTWFCIKLWTRIMIELQHDVSDSSWTIETFPQIITILSKGLPFKAKTRTKQNFPPKVLQECAAAKTSPKFKSEEHIESNTSRYLNRNRIKIISFKQRT